MDEPIKMTELLEKVKECDSFSLTGFDSNIALGNSFIQKALDNLIQNDKKKFEEEYKKVKEENSGLPDFETIWNDIHKEVYSKCNFILKNISMSNKKRKYTDPEIFFNYLYNEMYLIVEGERKAKERLQNYNKIDALSILPNELKNNLIRYEASFQNSVMVTGYLMVNYYFKLNDETRKWLLKHENNYDFNGELQDLAFYKNDKVFFATSTHEEYYDFYE